MIKIPRMSDRFEIKIGEVIFIISPMTYQQKAEINGITRIVDGEVVADSERQAYTSIKYSIKEVRGKIQNYDGTQYKLEMDGDVLSDNCVSELISGLWAGSLIFAAHSLIDAIPDEIIHPVTGKVIEGVSIKLEEHNKKKEDTLK